MRPCPTVFFKTGPVKGSAESKQMSLKTLVQQMNRKAAAVAEIAKVEARLKELNDIQSQPLSAAIDDIHEPSVPAKRPMDNMGPVPKKPRLPNQAKKSKNSSVRKGDGKKYKTLHSFFKPKVSK